MKKTVLFLFILMVLPAWAWSSSITVTKPVGGQQYCMFKQQWVYWQASGPMSDKVNIYLMHPNGQAVKRTIVMNAPNNGRYQWDGGVPDPGSYFIKVAVSATVQHPAMVSGQSGIFTFKDCQKPDLQVGVINIMPQNPGVGQTVTFKGNVMNYGVSPAPNPVVTLTVHRPAGLQRKIYRQKMDVTLQKNQGITFVKKFKVPEQGSYTCIFSIDPADMIAETNENNNKKSWTFGVQALPDLIVCISNGKRPPVGGKRDILAVVKNIGKANCSGSAAMKLRFHVEGKGTKTYDIPPLSPGGTHTIKRRHSWGTAGTKTISAKIMYSKNEVSKQNNEVKGAFFVRLPHHNKYSADPAVKCSTNENFNSWENVEKRH